MCRLLLVVLLCTFFVLFVLRVFVFAFSFFAFFVLVLCRVSGIAIHTLIGLAILKLRPLLAQVRVCFLVYTHAVYFAPYLLCTVGSK